MKNKFKLSHVVLYAKGWYVKSDDIWADLKQILEYDDYTPFTNNDVVSILLTNFEQANINNYNKIFNMVNGVGMLITNDNYTYYEAVVRYILNCLRFIGTEYYIDKCPKYNKITPRPKHIKLKQVITIFNKKQ